MIDRTNNQDTIDDMSESSSERNANNNNRNNLEEENIYEFYQHELLPSILASLPILFRKMRQDSTIFLQNLLSHFLLFITPSFLLSDPTSINRTASHHSITGALSSFFHTSSGALSSTDVATVSSSSHPSKPLVMIETIFKHFDTNGDGHISPSELLILKEKITEYYHEKVLGSTSFWWQAWPMIDWKIGIFLWRTCGGLLLLIGVLTIIPGHIHGYSGRILRFPILIITYFMISVELVLYIIIRLFIRLVEATFSSKKHRMLRNKLAFATTYEEWHRIAKELDISQQRTEWQKTIHEDPYFSSRYNFPFIEELMSDLQYVRNSPDESISSALAVLAQCTRKNVGGIMSDELFSHTNTGEPKYLVTQFIGEVETTLRWVTEQAISAQQEQFHDCNSKQDNNISYAKNIDERDLDQNKRDDNSNQEEEEGDFNLQHMILAWATLGILQPDRNKKTDTARVVKDVVDTSKMRAAPQAPPPTTTTFDNNNNHDLEKVKIFLKRARAAYGRTSLSLSGGAMMGCYHFGVIRALLEEDTLPHIISGTSAGSAIASMVCTRTSEEIMRDLKPEIVRHKLKVFEDSWSDIFRRTYETGCMFSAEEWHRKIQWFTMGDMTFEEAYRKTGRVLCITLSSTTKNAPPVLINYISAPDVVISSAVIASAAVPGFIKPVRLLVKDPTDKKVRYQSAGFSSAEHYWDGSIETDIPISGLSEMFNCQFFLAAQCNPHIVPFFYNSKGDVGRPSRWSRANRQKIGESSEENGVFLGHSWRGGFLLSALEMYLKSDMRAKFHFLNDIEVALGFTSTMMTQQFHGTTTIVPQTSFLDYFKLFQDASQKEMEKFFRVGRTAAYQHINMIKLHYRISHTLENCLAMIEDHEQRYSLDDDRRRASLKMPIRRRSILLQMKKKKQQQQQLEQLKQQVSTEANTPLPVSVATETSESGGEDNEYELSGFDGIEYGGQSK